MRQIAVIYFYRLIFLSLLSLHPTLKIKKKALNHNKLRIQTVIILGVYSFFVLHTSSYIPIPILHPPHQTQRGSAVEGCFYSFVFCSVSFLLISGCFPTCLQTYSYQSFLQDKRKRKVLLSPWVVAKTFTHILDGKKLFVLSLPTRLRRPKSSLLTSYH